MAKRITKPELERKLAGFLVEHFREYGPAYTCAAVVFSTIKEEAEIYAEEAQADGYKIKARRLMNLALEEIHNG